LRTLLGFAYITLKENARRRSFYGVVVAYLITLVFSRILMEFSLQDPTKMLLDFTFSFFSFLLTLSVLFIATDVMAKDLEKKSVYILLAKGISREGYVWGRAFGFLVFTLLLSFLLGVLFLVGTKLLNLSVPQSFRKEIDLIYGFLIVSVLWIKVFLLSTVVLFFSTFMTNFFLVFLVSVVVFIAGSSVENLYYFVNVEKDRIAPLVRQAVTFLFYILPSFSSPGPDAVLGTGKLQIGSLLIDLSKAITYALFLTASGSLLFRRRELM